MFKSFKKIYFEPIFKFGMKFNSIYKSTFCNLVSLEKKIQDCPGRENKYYLLTSISNNANGIKNKNEDKLFYLASLYSKYNKLKAKYIINPLYHNKEINPTVMNSDFDNVIDNHEINKKLFTFLKENNFIEEKINEDKETEYFLKLQKNSNFLPEIENENNSLKSEWPRDILSYHEKMLEKKSKVFIKFTIVNETDKSNVKNIEVDIPVDNPQFLFGVTFICIKSTSTFSNSFLLNQTNINNKPSFLLPTKVIFAINPINEEKIPIMILNNSHCSSNEFDNDIRACIPGHDHIDFQMAKENSLPIKFVVKPISEMGEAVFAKQDPINFSNRSKSIDQIKEEINKKKLSEGPLLFNSTYNEAFLINCKEFDFLYLDEARDLIVNNLIRKKKAERIESFCIKDVLIAKTKKLEIVFEDSFLNSNSYLRCIVNQYNSNTDDDSIKAFKKWLPVNLFISESSNVDYKNIFYSRILHKIFLNHFKKSLPSKNECNEEEVFISKEHEMEKDILFPAPYNNIIIFDDKTNIQFLQMKDKIMKTGIELDKLHKHVMETITQKFEVEKLRDEIVNVNESNNLVISINKEMIVIMDNLESSKFDKVIESFDKIANLNKTLIQNIDLLKKNLNFFIYIYLNHLLLYYLFDSNNASNLYREISSKQNSSVDILKQNLNEYSLEKMYETCKYFNDMLKNSTKIEIIINGISEGTIIVDKLALEIKENKLPVEHLIEGLNIKLIESDIEEYILENNKLNIKLKLN